MKHSKKSYSRLSTEGAAFCKNVPMRHGELTVMVGDRAEDSMIHSSKLGTALQRAGVGTLIINCGMSGRRFREHFDAHHKETYTAPRLVLRNTYRGDLASEGESLYHFIRESGITVVVVVGWEWAADTYRRRQRLLRFFREIMEELEVAIVVYAHTNSEPVAGKLDHGGLGKLALLARYSGTVEAMEELSDVAPTAPPLVGRSEADLVNAEKSVDALVRNITGIRVENRSDEGGDDGAFAMAA